MSEIIVQLPDIDRFKGVIVRGKELELQFQSGAPPRFPKPEDVSPDSWYSIRMSAHSARALVRGLSQLLSGIKE